MKRGEIRWCTLRAPDKRRPVLILTRNSAIPLLTSLVVAPLTTTIRHADSQIYLSPPEDGVPSTSVINLDNLLTVQKAQLEQLITVLTPQRMYEVEKAVCFSLGIDWAL